MSYGLPSQWQPNAPFFASPQGFTVTPLEDVFITALGYFEPVSMPYDPTAASVIQWLYGVDATGSLNSLARSGGTYRRGGNVGTGSVAGFFWYSDLAAPILLSAGQQYLITHWGPMQVQLQDHAPITLAPSFELGTWHTVQNGQVEGPAGPQTGFGFEYVPMSTVPEPASVILFGSGLLALGVTASKRKRKRNGG